MLEMFDLKIPTAVQASALAFGLAIIRIAKDRRETRLMRKLLEATICAGLAYTFFYAIRALGLNEDWAVFCGGFVGFMGSDFVRSIARLYTHKKLFGKGDK